MARDIGSKKAFKDEIEKELGPPEQRVDQEWCSDLCKKKISDAILKKYPCKQRFSQVDVHPLYACGSQRFYRVTLWVNDWSTDSFSPVKEIWKTVLVTLEGIERKIVSIEEGEKKRLELGENGLKFMLELETDKEKV